MYILKIGKNEYPWQMAFLHAWEIMAGMNSEF
jgi:hypothetical protein